MAQSLNELKKAQGSALNYLLGLQKDGLWPYLPGKQFAMEASVWAAIACRKNKASLSAFVSKVPTLQNADGGWSNEPARLESDWSSAAVFFALSLLQSKAAELDWGGTQLESVSSRAEKWLMDNRSEYYSSAAKFALLIWKGPQHDYERGWPWTKDTFDWVEPTSYVLLGFNRSKSASKQKIATAMELAAQYLLGLSCKDGGWNFGDRNPLGQKNRPDFQSSALTLLALKSKRSDAKVEKSLKWIKETKAESVCEKAWAALALASYGEKPETIVEELIKAQNSDGSFSTNVLTHAVACLAIELVNDQNAIA